MHWPRTLQFCPPDELMVCVPCDVHIGPSFVVVNVYYIHVWLLGRSVKKEWHMVPRKYYKVKFQAYLYGTEDGEAKC